MVPRLSTHDLAISRRQLLAGCTGVVAAHAGYSVAQHRGGARGAVLRRPVSIPGLSGELVMRVDPVVVKQLALRAIDAARAAGATYADVRLTRIVESGGVAGGAADSEVVGVGVRALVQGAWGFAASPVWAPDEVAALAQSAVAIAQANAQVHPRAVEWTPIPVATGDWTPPIEIDPFTVSLEERTDLSNALASYISNYRVVKGLGLGCAVGVSCRREERAVATTEGAYFTQTFYQTGVNVDALVTNNGTMIHCDWWQGLTPSGRGYELIRDAQLREQWPARLAELEELYRLYEMGGRSLDLGHYDVVADGWAMAALVPPTLGRATELDRALGFEANATGTSFLGPDPLAVAGTFQIGSPLVTLTADRSLPGGLATVQWDDEGVRPDVAPLITHGIVTDYQTTRAQVGSLLPYYGKAGLPTRSHGHAGADSALNVTTQHSPNFTLAPAQEPVALADLIADTKKGVLFKYGSSPDVDFQCKTGGWRGNWSRLIVNGKLGPLVNGHCIFNTIELWKNLTALGGATTMVTVDDWTNKGQPMQRTGYSVRAGAAKFTNLTFTR